MPPRKAVKSTKSDSHENRRLLALQHQKAARQRVTSSHRSIEPELDVKKVKGGDDLEENYQMDDSIVIQQDSTETINSKTSFFRRQLQKSSIVQTIEELPEDLTNWYGLFCPKGIRCFVFERNGKTFALGLNGEALFPDSSEFGLKVYGLPSKSMLDCIFVQDDNSQPGNGIFWVLDLMMWKGMPFRDAEAQFRYWWLTQQLHELRSPHFIPCPRINPITKDSLESALPSLSTLFPSVAYYWKTRGMLQEDAPCQDCDGILLYHNESRYTAGDFIMNDDFDYSLGNPLCCWISFSYFPMLLDGLSSEAMIE